MTRIVSALEKLIDLQVGRERRITKYIKRRRKNLTRLKDVEAIVGWLPEDLVEMYWVYDGVDHPQSFPEDLSNFFGHFFWETSRGLFLKNKTASSREKFPLYDEISFSKGRELADAIVTPTGGEGYIITAARSARSDVRYPAFDSIETMILTYIEALETDAWTFDADGHSHFDETSFLKAVSQNNTRHDYWTNRFDGTLDFKIDQLEQGKIRPRLTPVGGKDIFEASMRERD